MIPFGNETVTLVRRLESQDESGRTRVSYAIATLTGCSWRWTDRTQKDGEALVKVQSLVCRIPGDQAKPRPGDLLIRGAVAVTVNSGADFQRLIERYSADDGAFVVAAVSDNARPGMPLPHWAART